MTEKSQSGLIRISDDVISIIAGLAALNTPGIASMSGGISKGLTKRMSGKNAKIGVFVEVMESGPPSFYVSSLITALIFRTYAGIFKKTLGKL